MPKKYLSAIFTIFAFVFVFGIYHAAAIFIDKPLSPPYSSTAQYDVKVVSLADFKNDDIQVKANTTANKTLNFSVDYGTGAGYEQLGSYTSDDQGVIEFSVNHDWPDPVTFSSMSPYQVTSPQYLASFKATDPSTNIDSNLATYNLTITPAPITLTIYNNTTSSNVPNGGTVNEGDSLTFSCTNSLNMYLDNSGGGNPPISTYTGNNYSLSYGPVSSLALGTHTIGCTNIGTPNNDANSSFTVVKKSCPANQVLVGGVCVDSFDIKNISSNPNQTSTATTFTWTSEANTCNVYNYDKSTRLNPTSSTRSGTTFSAVVPGYNMPSNVGSYAYYIKCYSATKYPADSLEKDTDIKTGWKSYTINLSEGTCPTGQANFGDGCENVCPSNNSIPASSQSCGSQECNPATDVNCGNDYKCNAGYTFDLNTGKCEFIQGNPVCSWVPGSDYTQVQCVPSSYICPAGGNTQFTVVSTRGSTNDDPDSFAWENGQLRYDYMCGQDIFRTVKALVRPYTHFLTFNVSASSVIKGSGINLSWTVQDPNDSCKIVGKAIKGGEVVFDSKGDQSILDPYIATSTQGYSSVQQDLAVGNYKDIFDKEYPSTKPNYYKIDKSTRFTASCNNEGVYKPGYYQLVRDVYVTNESER